VTATPTPSGDIYEDDDTCANARLIPADGTIQTHTFHDAGDADWIKFNAQALINPTNQTYIIEVTNTGARADVVLLLYDTCAAASPLTADDNAFASTVRLEWDSTRNGYYYIKLQQHDQSVYGASTNYDVSVRPDTVPPARPRSLRAASGDQALTIQWPASPERDVVGYHVWWGTTSGVYSYEDVPDPDTTFYQLTGLTNGTRYYLALSAYDFSGNESTRSLEISAIPAPPQDQTVPSVTVNQPMTTTIYTTTLTALTIGGQAQDTGGNLSRVKVRNVTRGADYWDYSLSGSSAHFQVTNVALGLGANQIQVTAYDDANNTGSVTLTVYRQGATQGAVIILAGHNDSYGLQANIASAANRAYRVFSQRAGYSDDDIYYLSPTTQDPNNDGVADEVDGLATPDNLRYAIQTWAASRVGPGKPLHLYLMDHGEIEYFCTDGCGLSGRVTPESLDSWLTYVETTTLANEINIVIEACHSGSFIDRLGNPAQSLSKAGRVVISSTGRENNAYASAQGAYFSDAYFSCAESGGDLKTCFQQAREAVAATGQNQTPWIDDNGDGLPTPADGTTAQGRYVTRFFGGTPPRVISATVTIQAGSGILTATLEPGSEPITLVWAAVYAPSFQEPTATTLDLGVPLVRLDATEEVGLYRAIYPGGFAEVGQYRVVFYAQDRSGASALPRVVMVGQRVHLPLVLRNWHP